MENKGVQIGVKHDYISAIDSPQGKKRGADKGDNAVVALSGSSVGNKYGDAAAGTTQKHVRTSSRGLSLFRISILESNQTYPSLCFPRLLCTKVIQKSYKYGAR